MTNGIIEYNEIYYTKNYFFHSNVADFYFSQTDRTVPYIYDTYKEIQIRSIYNSNEWNKFIIYGKYYPETQDYEKTVFVNHAFDTPFSFGTNKKNSASDFKSIVFCENECQDLLSQNIHWTTGYYRDLRIWDGDMASYSQVVQYNDFFPASEFIQRVISIKYYFPFLNQYISNNNIIDPLYPTHKFTVNTGSYFLKKFLLLSFH